MPGYSEACVSGAHPACIDTGCRCLCHISAQQLVEKKKQETLRHSAGTREAVPTTELSNKCPKCGQGAKATDNFCRNDGTRLMLGKQCAKCGAPGDEPDMFCWQCSWKHGEPLPTDEPEPAPTEDPVVRARRIAKEQGLLKETAV